MKAIFWTILPSAAVACGAVAQGAAPAAPAAVPQIRFASELFDFGEVKAGVVVDHKFVFTNTGTAALEVKGVHPGCGCTTTGEWTRGLEPGATGMIPIRFDSRLFDGKVTKMVKVTSTDPVQPTVTLQITGTVWNPFQLVPPSALFTLPADEQSAATKVVKIISRLGEPVTLSAVESSSPLFRTELKTVEEGRAYELHVTPQLPMESSTRAAITVKTSSAEAPELRVTAQATVLKAVTTSPAQITLASGTLLTARQSSFTVRGTGKTPLVLSDLAVSLEGVAVKLQEVQPGRVFRVALVFPAGFELKPGQKAEVTVNTNHPKYPVIRVPVVRGKPVATKPAGPSGTAKPPDAATPSVEETPDTQESPTETATPE